MGVGKSTIGKKLAHKLGYDFLDLDAVFEKKFKITIGDFFSKYDESLFRNLEQGELKNTFLSKNIVVATGGGTACFMDSMDAMNKNGLSIYLEMSPGALANRLSHAKKKRPLLQGLGEAELLVFITDKLNDREAYYKQAQWTINALNIDIKALAERIQTSGMISE